VFCEDVEGCKIVDEIMKGRNRLGRTVIWFRNGYVRVRIFEYGRYNG
jgi:hypothetical protein